MPTPYLARCRQRETKPRAFLLEEEVRNLDQQAGAVAGFRVAATRSPMGEVDENLNAFTNDLVRLLALDVRDEANTTGVALIGGVVKALRLGKAGRETGVFLFAFNMIAVLAHNVTWFMLHPSNEEEIRKKYRARNHNKSILQCNVN